MHSYQHCSVCYIQENNPPTVDPRTVTNSSNHGLNTPSLIDVSESFSTRGEAAVELHDDSPNLVYDCASLVSDASQSVADECAVRFPFDSGPSPVSHVSSPSVDDESGNHTSISPFSPLTATPEPSAGMYSIPSPGPQPRSPSMGFLPLVAVPPRPYNFPQCPRTFSSQFQARYAFPSRKVD